MGFVNSNEALKERQRQNEFQIQVVRAEALFVQFVADHNLSFRIGYHFTKLAKKMFPDTEIAKYLQCSRTKTSILTRFGNGKFCHDNLVLKLKCTKPVYFCLLIVESNDRRVEVKDLVMLLRFFVISIMKVVTKFFDLPTSNNGTAAAIFAKIDESIVSNGLSYDHLVSFNSDTCNTMKGQRKGVVRHLFNKQSHMIDLGCICHLENLALKAAIKSLHIYIDSLLVDINTHFYRKEEFKEFCDFVNITYKKILVHVETRWLSLLRVVERVLQLWPALVSYFNSHPDAEKRGRVQTLKEQMCEETKLYLLFLNFILTTVNAFNVAFQATSYTTIHLLYPEMKKLTKRILSYFVNLEIINLIDPTQTPYQEDVNHLGDDDMEIGNDTRDLANNLREEGMGPEVDKFSRDIRLFYIKFVSTIFKKFPFNSTFLLDMRILNRTERLTYKDYPNAVIRLAKLLP